jgi:heme exporter protein D
MSWGSMADFFHMGGYGFYVWGSYAVTFALIALEAAGLASSERRTRARIERDRTLGAE